MRADYLVNGWCSTNSSKTPFSTERSTVQPETLHRITLVAHCDWSKAAGKRWMALAVSSTDNDWIVEGISKVEHQEQLFSSLTAQPHRTGCALVGFDFTIGLPQEYAKKTGITAFLTVLPLFGSSDWANFYTPAENPHQISLKRPFYTARPGGSSHQFLEKGLGIGFDLLYRECERAHANRRPACPLFWTLGGQQVGKAAITGWQRLIAPALAESALQIKIWPFAGRLDECCRNADIVVVETYPAEYYTHLGLSSSSSPRWSKRRQSDRSFFAGRLISLAQNLRLSLTSEVREKILDGFGSSADGEDQFDALIGLYGMINVIQGNRPFNEPRSMVISRIEGWIFGQEQP
jgi:hypothetical protein